MADYRQTFLKTLEQATTACAESLQELLNEPLDTEPDTGRLTIEERERLDSQLERAVRDALLKADPSRAYSRQFKPTGFTVGELREMG